MNRAEAVEAAAEVLAKLDYELNTPDDEHYLMVNTVLDVVGYDALLAEVERLGHETQRRGYLMPPLAENAALKSEIERLLSRAKEAEWRASQLAVEKNTLLAEVKRLRTIEDHFQHAVDNLVLLQNECQHIPCRSFQLTNEIPKRSRNADT